MIRVRNPGNATAAPPYPPISAWEELVGEPKVRVMRFQLIAPSSPASSTFEFSISICARPLLMVEATGVPKAKAAMNSKRRRRPIERREMVQLAEYLVRNFFAIVLDGFDDLDLLRHSGVVDSIFVKACAPATMFPLCFWNKMKNYRRVASTAGRILAWQLAPPEERTGSAGSAAERGTMRQGRGGTSVGTGGSMASP